MIADLIRFILIIGGITVLAILLGQGIDDPDQIGDDSVIATAIAERTATASGR